ncbi:unnamed protein product [marine sediment metagenome]|uniref:Uncharacterized protein n=1 Tax=marine sediment metagenome TaxID=412755 RepID=X1APP0_9ZZZZ
MNLTQLTLSARQVLRKALPRAMLDLEGVTIVNNTYIPGTLDIESEDTPCTCRVMVCLDQTANFMVVIVTGTTPRTCIFNAGQDLVADCVYMFDFPLHEGDHLGYFMSDTSGTLHILRVQELIWGGN